MAWLKLVIFMYHLWLHIVNFFRNFSLSILGFIANSLVQARRTLCFAKRFFCLQHKRPIKSGRVDFLCSCALNITDFTPKSCRRLSCTTACFKKFFGWFLVKLVGFFYIEFSKSPFYTKKFKNNNSDLVLRRQKKIGFFVLIPNFPKDIGDFSSS